ncbi:MAG TPA: sulfotransferase [Geminicoccus sp.]|uniref:sulfotransferase family protein n=1 Tax=Geminicoccus sp. TaxID=2024832 RepID=UPI002B827B81|nr:sulfotransferase [Geminicoccus sp.]HWL69318.1 sulfotransferase [Geminicoccus sp.]
MIGADGQSLAFLLGVPRSGTTLLSHLLDSHPDIASPPEPWLMFAVEAIGKTHPLHPARSQLIGQGYLEFTQNLDLRRAKASYATALYNEHLQNNNSRIFVDKTPRYYQIIDEIALIFPRCKFVYLKRHPFAVAGSLKSTWDFDLAAAMAASDNELLFDLVLGYRRLERFAADNPSRVHACTYDELVADSEQVLRSVLAILGADPDVASPSFISEKLERRRGRLGDQKILETRSIHQNSLWAWRDVLTREEKQVVHDIFSEEGIVALGFGDLIPALRAEGIVDHGPARAQEIAAEVEESYRAWLDLIDVTTREHPEAPKLAAALRKAARQPDDAIKLLGVEEDPLALIERQATALGRLENERARHLERISELSQMLAGLERERPAWQSLEQTVRTLLEETGGERAARQNLEQMIRALLEETGNERAARRNLEQMIRALLEETGSEQAARQNIEQVLAHVLGILNNNQKKLSSGLHKFLGIWK